MEYSNLRERLIEIDDESYGIIMEAGGAGQIELTPAQSSKLEKLDTEYKQIKNQLKEVGEDIDDMNKSEGRKTDTDDAVRNNTGSIGKFTRTGGNGGFNSLGELGVAVYNSGLQGQRVDPRLLKGALTETSIEGVGADGGYLVFPDYRKEILDAVMGEFSILGLCDPIVTSSNTVIIPADETTPWQTSGGLQVYWESEAGQKSQSKVALKEKTVKLNKVIALVPVSDELLEDAPSLDNYLRRTVGEKMDFAISLALVQGTGVGQPQGILNCPSLVTVDKESGQSADTIVFENIVNMWSRMYGPLRRNGVWLINQDIEPQLFSMSWEGTSSSIPAYLPANSPLSTSPAPTLLGRPVIPSQACGTIGDLGDILFCSWGQYLAGVKAGGIKEDVSIHLFFDYDVTAFRFVMRVGGQCRWSSAIDPRDGTNTLGAFIALAART